MRLKNIIIMAFVVVGLFKVKAQENTASEKLEQLFDYCYQNDIFNGTVLIKKEGDILLNKAYGFANIAETKDLKTSSAFYLASLSKQFTAFAIALLENDGKLEYDDFVQKHLPDFPYQNIKVSHLIYHTSGISDYQKLLNGQRDQLAERFNTTGKKVTNKDVGRIFSKLQRPLEFEPGINFEYSNTGYMYLALIVEAISDKTFAEFLEERIFSPLHMNASGVIDGGNDQHTVAGYKTDLYGKNVRHGIPEFFNIYGDGGIYSSIDDLTKWDQSLRNNVLLNKDKSKALYETPKIDGKESPYGMGWFVRTLPFNGAKAVTHSGIFVGYTNSIFRELDSNTSSIILSNNGHSSNAEINQAVIRILYGIPYELPKIQATEILSRILLNEGIQKAKEFYESQKSNADYDFSEKKLNRLGYDLMELDKLDEAIAIFKMNAETYPESSNVYDSLGEAYLKSGNNKLALKYYSIAYEKDPENQNAKHIIEKLTTSKHN